MRLSFGLLLPSIAGIAKIVSANIDGFVFTASKDIASSTVSLTLEQVRLALSQQLDITQYHSLNANDRNEKALGYITMLGGQHSKLFDEDIAGAASPRHLVVFLDIPLESSQALKTEWSSRGWNEPSFATSENPGRGPVRSLVRDMQKQISPTELPNDQCTLTKAIDESDDDCWNGKNSYIMFESVEESPDFTTFIKNQDSLFRAVNSGILEATFILMTPLQINNAAYTKEPWGSYSVPDADVADKRRQSEESMSKVVSSSSTPSNTQPTSAPISGLPPLCYSTLESCTTSTRDCSGHGKCVRKFGPPEGQSGASCFTCACYGPDYTDTTGKSHWGGAACQKQDISAQFWIIAGFSALLVGIVSWAIGMMFSIGSEKLPGVIGAGVASKTR